MIVLVTTRAHAYTHEAVAAWPGMPKFVRRSYRQLLARRSLPAATYIFTDFDRLNAWEVEMAAGLCRRLKAAGLHVLNDPACFRRRHALLTRLYRSGVNSFRSWSVEIDEMPDRFPVFLRTQAAHRGPLTGLLETEQAAREALEQARAEGFVAADLHFVEYAAEPMPNGVFRKMAAFRIGERILHATNVHSTEWVAKHGQTGVAGETAYREELEMVRSAPYPEQVMAAFEAAQIDYGRTDFVERGGRLEFFEINTNPTIRDPRPHPSADRMEAQRSFRDQYVAAMRELDMPAGGQRIAIEGRLFRRYRRKTRRFLGLDSWMP